MKSIRFFLLSPNEFGHLCKIDSLQESSHMDPRDAMAPAICPGLVCLLECRTVQPVLLQNSLLMDECSQFGVHAQIPIVQHSAEPGVLPPRSPVKNSQHVSGFVVALDPTVLFSSDHPLASSVACCPPSSL